jgi:hypothetical protein
VDLNHDYTKTNLTRQTHGEIDEKFWDENIHPVVT